MIKATAWLEGLRRERSRPEAPPFLVLTGGEEFLRAEALQAVLGLLGDEPETIVFDPERHEDAHLALFDELRTGSLFGSAKLVVVEKAEAFLAQHGDALAAFARSEPPTGVLALCGEELVKKRGRKVVLSAAVSAMEEAGGAVVDCAPLFDSPYGFGKAEWDNETTRWVVARFASFGKTAAPPVAHAVHRREGSGLRGVASQVEKIALHVGEREEIRIQDVDAVMGDDAEATLFEAVDAFGAREMKAVVGLVRRLFELGIKLPKGGKTHGESEIAHRLLPLIAGRLRELGRLTELVRGGEDFDDAVKKVLGPHRAWLGKKFAPQLRARNPRELGDALVALAALDSDLKSGRGGARDLTMRYLVEHTRVLKPARTAGGPENPFAALGRPS